MDIGQLLAEARLHRYAPTLRLQPLAEGGDQRRTARLAGRQALAGAHAADLGLDPVKLGDPAQPLGCDLGAVAINDFLQLAPGMRPAMGDGDRRAACPGWARQAVVAGIAIQLQDAVKALQNALCILAPTVRRIGEDHTRRISPAP